MTAQGREWVSAGITLAADPAAKVRCPECHKEFLVVQDVATEARPDKFERYLRCPACGKYNVLLMSKKE